MPDLCHRIERLRIKGTKIRKPASPATEPDFYSMPTIGLAPTSSRGEVNQKVESFSPSAYPPRKSRFPSPLAEPLNRHDDTLAGSPRMKSCVEGNRIDGTGVSRMMNKKYINQAPEKTLLEYSHTLETDTVLMAEPQSQAIPEHGQVKFVVGSTSHGREEMKESAHLDHGMLDRIDPLLVMPLNDLEGQMLSTSMDKISNGITDMTGFPPPYHIASSVVTDSVDSTRATTQLDNKPGSGKADSSHTVEAVSDDIPFLLQFQHPTNNTGKPNMSKRLSLIRPVHRLHSKIIPSEIHTNITFLASR